VEPCAPLKFEPEYVTCMYIIEPSESRFYARLKPSWTDPLEEDSLGL